ncbi:FecR domain-containing protein [Chitinophaga pendula]|uniref:FecR family protein n=1 Tax=Chitinophaga TaxID=79328 RepID=UPI000BB015D4|nr:MULTISPECIES: FecR family protein [Chitinophaga]ASZ09888.1 hypothetical protein CK934_02280 [Chitinophaga sp. MD30]UCJ07171.1 FecR domain-containing protein [Chitinophaga pendula]
MKANDQEQIIRMLEQYANGTLSGEDAVRFQSWLAEVSPAEFHAALDQCQDLPAPLGAYPAMSDAFREALERKLDAATLAALPAPTGGRKRHLLVRVAAAAAVLIGIGTGIYYLWRPAGSPGKQLVTAAAVADQAPGGNRALLTLADGSTIVLDSARDGLLAQQGATQVIKLKNGQLSYKGAASNTLTYNTISTPRGGQYQIALADGTVVWLNAASSLRFPSHFGGSSREVELTGEGYFEVAPMANQPFRVKAGNTTVDVLGTHFNINAYTDEQTQTTTLVEGAVRCRQGNSDVVLKPGQQAQVNNEALRLVKMADLEQVLAWKNGYFQFDGTPLPQLIRQIARWYDLEVQYEGQPPAREFSGKISRTAYLSGVMKALQLSDVHCRLEGKRLIILP